MTGSPDLSGQAIPRYVPALGDSEHAAIQRDYLAFLIDVAEQCGPLGRYQRRGRSVVLVSSSETARALLIDGARDLTKGALAHTAFRALLGESLSMSEDDRHDRLRRLLTPLFSHRQMTRYAERIVRTAHTVGADWADDTDIDLFAELHRLTVHTLGRALVCEPSLWIETGQFWKARERLWLWINGLALQRRRLADEAADPLAPQIAAAIITVQEEIDEIIRERQQRNWRPDDLLSDLLGANACLVDPLHPSEVRDQIIALLFAAHETSAAALFWALYLLARHPDVQERVDRELVDVRAARLHEVADVTALPYTRRVIKEAMRLYPPAARQFRVAIRDTTLAGRFLPAGTAVSVCHYVLHRHQASFPEPDQFDPERFAPGAHARPPLSYLPFGAGERICLGRHYAMQEIHLLLAVLLSRFRFEFPEAVAPYLAVTLRPHATVRVRVRHRCLPL